VTNLHDNGAGSLRDAIAITPAGGTVDFQGGLTGTITLTTGTLTIGKDLTISGPGATLITISGGNNFRVFAIPATFNVTLSGLMITGGHALTGNGGGIDNAGTLTVSNSNLSFNAATAGTSGGGAINNAASGSLQVIRPEGAHDLGAPRVAREPGV
jgi:hypothetical protein